MQSKESLACEAGEYLGRLRRAMPMQVYIYTRWQLKLSGNANLHLYQCWFAFTHRSPIKKFCKLSFTRKNFASLRLRKNLVELRARLSLLVDKTTFQYSVLTIHYTTIDGHAPPPSPAPAAMAEGDAMDVTDHTTTGASTPRGMGTPGRDGITTTSARRRSGRNALDMLDHSYQRQHGTGTPSGVFKSYIFPSGFFYKNTNRRASTPPLAASGI